MENNNLKASVMSNLIWKLMERGGTQGIQFIIQIVLARILLPEDYGVVAILAIFISLANVFVQGGLNMALIQKKDSDEKDFSSVFYLTLGIATFLYFVLFSISPFIAKFYQNPILKDSLRVLSVILFFGAFNSIQIALVSKKMQFKKLFFSSLTGILLSGVIGIFLAYLGFGVWALVFQQLINQFTIVIILWLTVKWRPTLYFSIYRVKELFSFGWKILVSSAIYNLYNDLRTLIIGKVYNPAVLGYYNRGMQFPQFIVNNIDGSIQSVMFPAFSAYQDDRLKLKNMVRRSISTSSFIILPLMVGLIVIAEPMVKIILTEKWLHSVPFIQIFSISFAFWPMQTANQQAMNAIGRSDISLKTNIIKRLIELIILGITVFQGVIAIAIGGVIASIIGVVVSSFPNKKLIDYGFREQLLDIIPSAVLSITMGIVVMLIKFLHIPTVGILLIQIMLGAIFYFSAAKLFKIESFDYLISTIKLLIKKK